MKTTETRGMMSTLRNRKGFSLVEMAVVLVIVGIIIGAVMKGQDLMTNARAKQVTSAVNTWKALAFAYMDRNGNLPGDNGKDGVIANQGSAANNVYSEYSASRSSVMQIKNTMVNAPANPVKIGSLSFWVYFGNVPARGDAAFKSAMFLCKDSACANTFTADELEIVKAIDTAIDGSANAGNGQFRASSNALEEVIAGQTVAAEYIGYLSTKANFANFSTSTDYSLEWLNTDRMAVWAFDRPF